MLEVKVTCPHCQATRFIPTSHRRKKGTCPECQKTFLQIPARGWRIPFWIAMAINVSLIVGAWLCVHRFLLGFVVCVGLLVLSDTLFREGPEYRESSKPEFELEEEQGE